ncbi:MAG: metalloregulator ArsR/SmtB family transcription factor [Halanaerobium sp.]|nr:metalloregulator ArsR/SmtB family transcription factor [Halanaerobium sp.]
MAIVINNISKLEDNISFTYNLVFEMFVCLCLLSSPDDYAHRDYALQVRKELPDGFIEQIDFWGSFEKWFFMLDLLTKHNLFPLKNIENVLQYINELHTDEFLNTLWQKEGAWKEKDEERYRTFETSNYDELLRDPEEKVVELKQFIQSFYQQYYTEILQDIEVTLLRSINEKIQERQKNDLDRFLGNLGRKVSIQDDKLILDVWINRNLQAGKDVEELVLVPVNFARPHHLYDDTLTQNKFYLGFETSSSPFLDQTYTSQEEIDYLAGSFRSLADPTRLNILLSLSRSPACNQDLARELGLTKSTISKHIHLLRTYNFLEGEEDGNRIFYYIDQNRITQLLRQLNIMLTPGFKID